MADCSRLLKHSRNDLLRNQPNLFVRSYQSECLRCRERSVLLSAPEHSASITPVACLANQLVDGYTQERRRKSKASASRASASIGSFRWVISICSTGRGGKRYAGEKSDAREVFRNAMGTTDRWRACDRPSLGFGGGSASTGDDASLKGSHDPTTPLLYVVSNFRTFRPFV